MVAALACLVLVAAADGAAAAKGIPGRAAAPVVRVAGVEYVSVADASRALELSAGWIVAQKTQRLTGRDSARVEIEAGSREISFNGKRVFLGQPVLLRNRQLYFSRIDYERVIMPLLRPSLVPNAPGRPRVIAIDPGHGGGDPGTSNADLGLREKDLALDVGQRLRRLLEQDGYRVVMTRTTDTALPDKTADFRRRSEVANAAGADLFISIHFNALTNRPDVGGSEVFVFTRQHQRSDNSWNSKDNDADSVAVPVNAFDAWSSLFASRMQVAVQQQLKTPDRGLKTMHSGPLRWLNCPGILIESLFLSNPTEAARVARPEYRQEIAEALRQGVRSYASTVGTLGLHPGAK